VWPLVGENCGLLSSSVPPVSHGLLDLVFLQQRLEARVVAGLTSALLVEVEHPDVGLIVNTGEVD
jgi:hypothetical protein